MSSFQKRRPHVPIPGTRPSIQNGLLLASSGNPSLDQIIGGGLPLGSILLIEEDKFLTYSKVLTKYFLAEGVFSNHGIFLASLDDEPNELLKKLPLPADENVKNHSASLKQHPEDMRIAFRYNDLPQVNSEQSTVNIGHNFDLSKQIDEITLKKATITTWNTSSVNCQQKTSSMFHNKHYLDILENLRKTAQNPKFSNKVDETGSSNTVLRVCLTSLGSPLWYDAGFSKDFIKFLTIFKSIIRISGAVCMITIPMHLLNHLDEHLVHRIRNLVDFSVELEAFAGSDKDTNPAFKEYSGLLFIRRIVALNSLAVYCPETTDLAFKLRRKKFVIEKLHLPPELQETEPREADEIIPATSCSSSKNHLLEF